MAYETLLLDVADSGVATITLNRPKVLNSLNTTLLQELIAAVDVVEADNNIRALVITGNGRGFCAGADLAEGGGSEGEKPKDPAAALIANGHRTEKSMKALHNPLISKIWNLEKPVINAINGVAAGGGMGLALTADIVIAARSAKFVCVFVPQLAILPDMGATWHLERLLGPARAMGIAMLGDKIPADQAKEWGMIWDVVEDEDLMPTATALAERLADGPTRTYPKLRRAIQAAENNNLDAQLRLEAEAQGVLCGTAEMKEGVIAFLQKRKPNFKDI